MKSKKEWYLPKDLAGVGGLSPFPSNVTRKARQEGWIKREAKGIKGGGFEFHYSSLPDKVQRALGFLEPMPEAPQQPSQGDLQQRIRQLEDKLNALIGAQQATTPPDGISHEEWQLVQAYRLCSKSRQVCLLDTAKALAVQTKQEQKESEEPLKDHQVA